MRECEELTIRQLEVLALHASGMTAIEIAEHAYFAAATVRNYLKESKKTTGAKNLAQLVAWCVASHRLRVKQDGTVVIMEG